MVQKRLHAGPTHFDKLKPEPGPNPTYNSDWHRLLLFSADPINEMPGRRCSAVEGALRQLVNLFEDLSFLDVSKTCYLERRTRSKNYNRCISGAQRYLMQERSRVDFSQE